MLVALLSSGEFETSMVNRVSQFSRRSVLVLQRGLGVLAVGILSCRAVRGSTKPFGGSFIVSGVVSLDLQICVLYSKVRAGLLNQIDLMILHINSKSLKQCAVYLLGMLLL